jgi:hypothetical protein
MAKFNGMSREERLNRLRIMRENDFSEPEQLPAARRESANRPISSGKSRGGGAGAEISDQAAWLIAESLRSLLRSR